MWTDDGDQGIGIEVGAMGDGELECMAGRQLGGGVGFKRLRGQSVDGAVGYCVTGETGHQQVFATGGGGGGGGGGGVDVVGGGDVHLVARAPRPTSPTSSFLPPHLHLFRCSSPPSPPLLTVPLLFLPADDDKAMGAALEADAPSDGSEECVVGLSHGSRAEFIRGSGQWGALVLASACDGGGGEDGSGGGVGIGDAGGGGDFQLAARVPCAVGPKFSNF